MSKNQEISAIILKKVNEGMNVIEALKSVVGEENADKMITELYEDLKK